MFKQWQQSFSAWKGTKAFLRDCVSSRAVTFFSEGRPYLAFLRPVIDELSEIHNGPVYYLSSDIDDPYLLSPPNDVKAYFIGKGAAMIYLFSNIKSGTMVMTMPDLNKYHIKRSAHPLHYVYIFHSMVSTHMVYREGAFDHFDTMLCVGPHQKEEIRAWEKLRALPEKNLRDHGYGPLDTLMLSTREHHTHDANCPNVLVAPSWGPKGLLETVGLDLISILLSANYKVMVRPHPRTQALSPKKILRLRQKFGRNKNFSLDLDTSNFDSFLKADVMIGDWSGAAMEFSLGLQKPVLFIDLPPKINNQCWSDICQTPFEVSYRKDVGTIITPSQLNRVPQLIRELLANTEQFKLAALALRKRCIFNVGSSGGEGAKILREIAQNPQASSIY